jgi:broad specificity phosphatase PhoE
MADQIENTKQEPFLLDVVAVRHGQTHSVQDALGNDLDRVLTDTGREGAIALGRTLTLRNLKPTHSYATSAVRTAQTAEAIAPDAIRTVFDCGYPGKPDVNDAMAAGLEANFTDAVDKFASSTLSWAQVTSCVYAHVAEEWVQTLGREIKRRLAQLSPGDVALIVGHGSTALVAMDQSLQEVREYVTAPLAGAIVHVRVYPSEPEKMEVLRFELI